MTTQSTPTLTKPHSCFIDQQQPTCVGCTFSTLLFLFTAAHTAAGCCSETMAGAIMLAACLGK